NRFSEGQASSLILVAAAAGGELTGLLPFNVMHLVAASLLCGAALVVFVFEQSNQSNRAGSLSRQHLMEIADVILNRALALKLNRALALKSNRTLALKHDSLSINTKTIEKSSKIGVEKTSSGLLISAGRIEQGRGCLLHYSISAEKGSLNDRAARRLARMLARFNGSESVQLVKSSHAFHALIFVGEARQSEHR